MIEEKAKQFSPKTIESLFNQMIADQLIFIELLGAILGALSGLALININYLLIVTFAGFGYFAIDTLLTKQGIKNRIKDRHNSDIKPTF